MLSLSQRTCLLGEKYGGKKLKDADVRTLKIELHEIELDEQEVNALFNDPYAYKAMHNVGVDPHEPALKGIKAFELEEVFESAHVALFYELGATSIELKKARLTKLKLTPARNGNPPRLSLVVEGEPPLNKRFLEIIERVGTGIECQLSAASESDQQELALNAFNNPGEGFAAAAKSHIDKFSKKRKRESAKDDEGDAASTH